MKTYVAGFMFTADRAQVALIWKNKPDWQKGRVNGIGGAMESGETMREAMQREFAEETGVDYPIWDWFATLRDNEQRIVHFFRAFSDLARTVKTTTDEIVGVFDVDNLDAAVLPNLRYLIPMALDERKNNGAPFTILESPRDDDPR